MNTIHRIDLSQIPATYATDQQPITLHYGQHFTTMRHQRAHSHYPTASSEIISPQHNCKQDKEKVLQPQICKYSNKFQMENAKKRINSVQKILTVKQIKKANIKLQKLCQNYIPVLINHPKTKQVRVELRGYSNKKRIQLSKYFQQMCQGLSC